MSVFVPMMRLNVCIEYLESKIVLRKLDYNHASLNCKCWKFLGGIMIDYLCL